MTAYYNDNDPYAAQWLRNLIEAGHIAPGHVDERDIRNVKASELDGFTQCHFFAGVGVWSHALRLAGWPDDIPVWTGSCPCQPFSAAGKRKGAEDDRHLWPVWVDLIRECRPGIVIGEQVASKDGLAWWDIVQADLENAHYASAALDLCAAGFGAPHWRQRLYFTAIRMADANATRSQECRALSDEAHGRKKRRTLVASGDVGEMADAASERWNRGQDTAEPRRRGGFENSRAIGGMDDAKSERHGAADLEFVAGRGKCAIGPADGAHAQGQPAAGPTNGFWRDADWLFCRDGKWRPAKPGTFPLAVGIANRVAQLRAYGNAVVAPQAVEFVAAVKETIGEMRDRQDD